MGKTPFMLPDQARKPFALFLGIVFGFLLQKAGVTHYDVIVGQLLLTDFTVVRVMLAAVITGMVGIHVLHHFGLVSLHPKQGSIGTSVIGGLIFGLGFGILGYCPGTVAGAVGQGSMDALFGGVIGMLVGMAAFSELYPKIEPSILRWGDFGDTTLPFLFHVSRWKIVLPMALLMTAILWGLSFLGL